MTFTIHATTVTCDRCHLSRVSDFPDVLQAWVREHVCEDTMRRLVRQARRD